MFQTMALGAWSCTVTAAAIFFGTSLTEQKADISKVTPVGEAAIQYSTPTMLVAPILLDTKVTGYLFSNVVVGYSPTASKTVQAPMNTILQDAYLSFLVGNLDYAFPKQKRLNFIEFKKGLQAAIIDSVGADFIISVHISDLNFLTRGEVRTKQTLKSVWLQDQQNEATLVSEPKKKGGH